MPIHVHPWFRSLEEAEESNGLIQTLDSQGVTIKKQQESDGSPGHLGVKDVPVAFTRILRDTAYTAS